jgi:hypothetical protein
MKKKTTTIGITIKDVLADTTEKMLNLYNFVQEDLDKDFVPLTINDINTKSKILELVDSGKVGYLKELFNDKKFVLDCSPRVLARIFLIDLRLKGYKTVVLIKEDEVKESNAWWDKFMSDMSVDEVCLLSRLNDIGIDYLITAEENIIKSFGDGDGKNVIKYNMPYNTKSINTEYCMNMLNFKTMTV